MRALGEGDHPLRPSLRRACRAPAACGRGAALIGPEGEEAAGGRALRQFPDDEEGGVALRIGVAEVLHRGGEERGCAAEGGEVGGESDPDGGIGGRVPRSEGRPDKASDGALGQKLGEQILFCALCSAAFLSSALSPVRAALFPPLRLLLRFSGEQQV